MTICSAGQCAFCGCHFRRPTDVMYHRCAAMQQAEDEIRQASICDSQSADRVAAIEQLGRLARGDDCEELVTGAVYRYVPQPAPVTIEAIERAFQAGSRWFAEHPDGASADDEWRDFYRTVLLAADLRS